MATGTGHRAPAVHDPGVQEHRFHAMGTACHLVAVGGPRTAASTAERRVHDLERRWSRFLVDSDVSRLNRADGRPVAVGPETLQLLDAGRCGWRDTLGRFDPTMLPWLEAAGYDDDLDRVRARGDTPPAPTPAPAPLLPPAGLAGLELDPVQGTARLPAGVRFDPGGVGKGLAADLVVAELLAAGTAGALVSLGGDLAVAGVAPDGDAWGVAVGPEPDALLGRLALRAGGVATSTASRRTWRHGGRQQHHAIDPSTGHPVADAPRAVTVVAGRAWRAETVATALLVTGDRARRDALVVGPGTGALVVEADGGPTLLGRIEEHLR